MIAGSGDPEVAVHVGGYVHKHLTSPAHHHATSARPSPHVLEPHDSSEEV